MTITIKEFVGVRSKWGSIATVWGLQQLKRDALIFDRIAITNLNSWLYHPFRRPNDALWNHLKWLEAKSIIFDPLDDLPIDVSRLLREFEPKAREMRGVAQKLRAEGIENLPGFEREHLTITPVIGPESILNDEYLARLVSTYIHNADTMDAHPVFVVKLPSVPSPTANKTDVIHIALNTLPIPSELVPWEEIIEYRNDPDARGKFLGLKSWINEMTKSSLPPVEIKDKLEWLLYDYRKHMELHKLKVNMGVLETIIVTGAEIIEDVVKFNWSKAAKVLFSVKHRKVALLESELNNPNREIAFLYDTISRFSKK